MDIGIVGLGRMGGNMARRLARGGVRVIGHDPDAAVTAGLAREGVLSPGRNAARTGGRAGCAAPRVADGTCRRSDARRPSTHSQDC